MNSIDDDVHSPRMTRRNLFVAGGVAAGAVAALGRMTTQVAAQETAGFGWGDALQRIRARGSITFAMPGSMSPPQYYRAPDTGEPAGYDVAVAKLIARDLEVEPIFEEAVVAARILGVQSGRYDVAMGGTANSPVRASTIAFTRGYIPYELVLVVGSTNAAQSAEDFNAPGTTITVLSGSTSEYAARDLFPNATINPLKINEAMLEVAAGRAQACLVEYSIAVPFSRQHGTTKVLANADGPVVIATEYGCLAVNTAEMGLRYWLDNWLYWYESRGTMKALYDQIIGSVIDG